MKSLVLIVAVLALDRGATMAAQPPIQRWFVISKPSLDPRLRSEIITLAAREGARVRFLPDDQSSPPAQSKPGILIIELRDSKDRDSWTGAMDREGYRLVATYPPGKRPGKIQIHAMTPAGFHYGVLRIPNLLRSRPDSSANLSHVLTPMAQQAKLSRSPDAVTISISDFPSFPERGIVEGFYGKPWSHQDRLDILRFEGEHGMNVYYYAPKDDPYHRQLWRKPYPPREYGRLGELVKAARANFVDFYFAISPGLSIRYSSEDDFQQLARKLGSVGKLGVSCFALFLDDVAPELQDADDRQHFKTLAQAHAALINKLYDCLKAQSRENRLVVTPTTYTNAWGKRDYIEELGALVRRDVPLVWTGIDTFSPVISAAQAREWTGLIKRPPLVWDNFPVNDAEPWRPYLGPMAGRGPDLAAATQGLFSNPMVQARASMIPLATVADYLWNPSAYDPANSLARAVDDQYGKQGAKLLEPLLKTYGDYHWDENLFTPLFYSRRYPFDTLAMEERLAQLDRAIQELAAIPKFKRLAAELAPFIPRTRKRLGDVLASPAFAQLADGRLAPREDYDLMEASRLAAPPALDGNFSKWKSGRILTLDEKSQILYGAKRWRGPDDFSARVALGWDSDYLYIGCDVTDSDIDQTHAGRGIEAGDYFSLTLQTALRKNYAGTNPTGDEYRIYFSPGNFSDAAPSLFSDEDYLPPRNRPHDNSKEIRVAWVRTPRGYSGDIAIPSSYFDCGSFREGYEIGLGFAVQNLVRKAPGRRSGAGPEKIVFISKKNTLFPVYLGNPSSYPRLVLVK